jgi:hypothetical protein
MTETPSADGPGLAAPPCSAWTTCDTKPPDGVPVFLYSPEYGIWIGGFEKGSWLIALNPQNPCGAWEADFEILFRGEPIMWSHLPDMPNTKVTCSSPESEAATKEKI